ncbi:sensor histidine kinase [Perlabentimonas gracilis]|uniref:sensor histidine kinase n=1 Tax=Perlabentimonas gracilis TaxID=2715279 RepID=UPI00140A7B93|nr:ATP-binding protein [Perlabentimonas gracilis]NHB67929.1 GHKL domain-containing protein [Perlabentimonas gracilis]
MVIAYFAIIHPDWLILANLLVVLIAQVLLLVRSQNAINRELELFFDTLKSFDSTSKFAHRLQGKDFSEIYKKFDDIIESFQAVKIENQQQNEYLGTLIEHINIGIISINSRGDVTLANSAAKKLLGISNLKTFGNLENLEPTLSSTLKSIEPNEQRLISLFRSGNLMQLSVRASMIKFRNDEVKIISFQNIKNEMDAREMEGWQKLIRVLTHELMNSAGPINSTISTLLELLSENSKLPDGQTIYPPEVIADITQGLKIIEERSSGMVEFVTRFRNLTLIPKPNQVGVNIISLFESIKILLNDELKNHNIDFSTIVTAGSITVLADRGMLEQILINLTKNAIEAVQAKQTPIIKLSAWKDSANNVFIEIVDNGAGIPPELHDKVFVPFFTTRKNGTGIGLSLSRQLANVQGGSLSLSRSISGDTIFTLRLKSS